MGRKLDGWGNSRIWTSLSTIGMRLLHFYFDRAAGCVLSVPFSSFHSKCELHLQVFPVLIDRLEFRSTDSILHFLMIVAVLRSIGHVASLTFV